MDRREWKTAMRGGKGRVRAEGRNRVGGVSAHWEQISQQRREILSSPRVRVLHKSARSHNPTTTAAAAGGRSVRQANFCLG